MWVMYMFAAAVGIVSAGLVGSLWLLIFNERLYFHDLFQPSWRALFAALAVVYNAPILLFETGLAWMAEGRAAGSLFILLASGWSFLQGVFILTQVFSLT